MLIRRRASLVYRLTDDLRQRLGARLAERLARLQSAVEAVESALGASPAEAQRARLEGQHARLVRARDECRARMHQVEGLGPGDEIAEGSVEVLSDVNVGDPEERLRDAQIVIQDGHVVEIRNA